MYFEIFKNAGLVGAQWRWRLRAANNEKIASGGSYRNKQDCLRAIELLKSTNASTPVKEI